MTRSSDAELEKLYRRLTAKERAKLEIERWHEDREPDLLLRKHTPDYQMPQINAYLWTAESANDLVAALVLWLSEHLEGITLRHAIVSALRLHELLADRVRMTLLLDLPEPVTATEAARRLDEQRAERLPIDEAAWLLVDHELDGEELDADYTLQEARIQEAAKAGRLRVERGHVRYGELLDWADRESRVLPDWGATVAVLPDGSEDYVERVRTFRERLFAIVNCPPGPAAGEAGVQRLVVALRERVAQDLAESWGIVLAIEQAVAILERDFEDTPVVHPATLLELEAARERLKALVAQVQQEGLVVALPEGPEPELAALLQRRFKS